MNSDWFKGSLVLAATLSAGIGIGIWHERSTAHDDVGHATETMRLNHEHVVQMLDHSLKLDSTQHRAIVATLHRHQSLIDSAWGALRPHVSARLDSAHAELMNLLRPEQREAFRRMVVHAHGGSHR